MSSTQTASNRGGARAYLKVPSLRSIGNMTVSAVDRVADYHTRQNIYNSIRGFCYRRPIVASFLAVQLIFAFFPLLFFLFFSLGVLSFCLLTALAISGFWIGLAGLIFLCTVSLLSILAGGLWVYLMCCYYLARLAAGYAGLLGDNNDDKAIVVAKTQQQQQQQQRREEYNQNQNHIPANSDGKKSPGAEKKVVFDVKDEQEQDGQDRALGDMGNNEGENVEIKKEEEEVKEDGGEKQQTAREHSPSQHSDGDYLDIRSV